MKFGIEDTSFKAAGEQKGVTKLVADFYRIMDQDPDFKRLREMHTNDLSVSEDKLAVFLCGWLGGPRLYRKKYGAISIPLVHQHLKVNDDEKMQWLNCMKKAIALQNYSQEFSDYLIQALTVPAERIVMAGKQ